MAQSLKSIIASIPEAELRNYLLELATKDAALQNRIRARFSQPEINEMRMIVQHEVDALLSRCEDRDGFISYYKAMDFEAGLEKIIDDYIDPLLADDDASTAIPLIGIIFDAVQNAEMDDDGETMELLEACMERWEAILAHADDDQREQLAKWMERNLNAIHFSDPQEMLFDFYVSHFQHRPFIQNRFKQLDQVLQP